MLHIAEKVSHRFEISAIMKSFADGPILHLEDVEGYKTKVIGNVCGTRSRIYSALEVSKENF